jgi:DNA repair exonuclease SbcCD ATPase subunit
MLNVSATQELAKEVEALRQQNSDLQDQAKRLTAVEQQERATIAKQEADILALKAANEKLTAMAAKMEALEKAVATMQEKENGGVRTVALSQ